MDVSISCDNHPHLLEGDAAIEYYNDNLLENTPAIEFTFQGTALAIINCIILSLLLGILISMWFMMIGPVAFIVAHIIVTLAFTYFGAYTHNLQWYEENNQYVFIMKYIFSKKEEITIYNRQPYDYISIYKIVGPSGPYSSTNRFYAIRDENQNHIMKLDMTTYDYQITEFSHTFSFTVKDESQE